MIILLTILGWQRTEKILRVPAKGRPFIIGTVTQAESERVQWLGRLDYAAGNTPQVLALQHSLFLVQGCVGRGSAHVLTQGLRQVEAPSRHGLVRPRSSEGRGAK